jgi:CRISPR-associated endonuclease Cas1 subtype II
MNYLVCRGDTETRINVDEISTLIIQNVGVAITAALLSRLMEGKIKVIFCDPKSNPQGELVPYYGSCDSYAKISLQMKWGQESKDAVWALITRKKILGQAANLAFFKKGQEELLRGYADEVLPGDPANREGHAAKVYFAACFGSMFSRDVDCPTNAYLNYGYSIVLSSVNRDIKDFGYLTELGIHHIGVTNPFNLSCDLMEPLRPIVDAKVLSGSLSENNFKESLAGMLNDKVSFAGSEMFLDNAIHDYVQSVLIALRDGDPSKMVFLSHELS